MSGQEVKDEGHRPHEVWTSLHRRGQKKMTRWGEEFRDRKEGMRVLSGESKGFLDKIGKGEADYTVEWLSRKDGKRRGNGKH